RALHHGARIAAADLVRAAGGQVVAADDEGVGAGGGRGAGDQRRYGQRQGCPHTSPWLVAPARRPRRVPWADSRRRRQRVSSRRGGGGREAGALRPIASGSGLPPGRASTTL